MVSERSIRPRLPGSYLRDVNIGRSQFGWLHAGMPRNAAVSRPRPICQAYVHEMSCAAFQVGYRASLPCPRIYRRRTGRTMEGAAVEHILAFARRQFNPSNLTGLLPPGSADMSSVSCSYRPLIVAMRSTDHSRTDTKRTVCQSLS